jgi:2-oxoglutarate ferredoxin oxidoreductase subunit alpha
MEDIRLMKGNEAVAEAAIRAGADAYFGYPITPQSEVMEYLTAERTEERTGMIVLQAESEVGAINMVYGAAAAGKKAIITSSSPGVSLMQEGISYLAAAELPCLLVNVVRGGPGLGTIQPSQGDYFQATRGGGHGDYRTLVLGPASVQDMSDFVKLGFRLAFKYRNPVLILTDGMIGQMMEKVSLFDQVERLDNKDIPKQMPWAATGKPPERNRQIIKCVELNSESFEKINLRLQSKYKQMQEEDVIYETNQCEDADYLLVAYGSVSRICLKAIEKARKQGIKVGLLRPVTLFPFPDQPLEKLAGNVRGILTVEMNAGQMVEDVRLAVNGKAPVAFHGRMGGMIPSSDDIIDALKSKLIGD